MKAIQRWLQALNFAGAPVKTIWMDQCGCSNSCVACNDQSNGYLVFGPGDGVAGFEFGIAICSADNPGPLRLRVRDSAHAGAILGESVAKDPKQGPWCTLRGLNASCFEVLLHSFPMWSTMLAIELVDQNGHVLDRCKALYQIPFCQCYTCTAPLAVPLSYIDFPAGFIG